MIRLSEEKDREGLISLWEEAFGDNREAIELFLSKRALPQNTIVAEKNGKIASMLFLLDGKIKVGKSELNAYYLYAAATLKEFRGKGIMAQMLEAAKELAFTRKIDLICLKPAEKSLYDFYKKHGYQTIFKLKKAAVKLSESENFNFDCGCSDMYSARETAFKNFDRFIWDCQAVDFAAEQHIFYGGSIFGKCNGYCLYSVEGNKIVVKELAFTADDASQTLAEIASKERLSEFIIDLPLNYPIECDEFIETDNGMALLISKNSEEIVNNKSLYLNLTLD